MHIQYPDRSRPERAVDLRRGDREGEADGLEGGDDGREGRGPLHGAQRLHDTGLAGLARDLRRGPRGHWQSGLDDEQGHQVVVGLVGGFFFTVQHSTGSVNS